MTWRTKKVGPVGRFGPRYGLKIREKIKAIEIIQRKKHKCPYCSKRSVRRIAFGIFKCKSCNAEFTGKAYYI